MNTLELKIATHFLPTLINDDWTGLEDDEALKLEQFLAEHPNVWWLTTDGEPECARCAVSGLMADVETVIGEIK